MAGHDPADSRAASPATADKPGRLLLTAATAMELEPLRQALAEQSSRSTGESFDFLVCGVGPTAAAATLAGFLARRAGGYSGVIMSGVAGAYPAVIADTAKPGPAGDRRAESGPPPTEPRPGHGPGRGPGVLDICLANREILGDFGLSAPHGAEPFDSPELGADHEFDLESPLLQAARQILQNRRIFFHCGTFVTVNAATTTQQRGVALARRHGGLCENMEGAAAALVCRNLGLPLLEIRCISNLVEDRDLSRWRLAEAIRRNVEILASMLPELLKRL